MSSQAFTAALVTGAALLALWIMARHAGFGPRSLIWAAIHVIVAIVLLRLVPAELAAIRAIHLPALAYVQVFGVALPLLVYGFLSGGWVTRIALGLLRP
jgi:hypothetical protein